MTPEKSQSVSDEGALESGVVLSGVYGTVGETAPLSPVREHQDIPGVAAGRYRVEYFDFGYALYADGVRVAAFAEGRVGYREWARRNGRLNDIHSLDDRYDHDIDELMA